MKDESYESYFDYSSFTGPLNKENKGKLKGLVMKTIEGIQSNSFPYDYKELRKK